MFETKADAVNAVLMLGVMVPPALLVQQHRAVCGGAEGGAADAAGNPLGTAGQVVSEWVTGGVRHDDSASCDMYLHRPFWFVNLLYLVVVDLGFWAIYLAQGSTWLIDPHWQFIPMCISFFYYSHPTAAQGHPRAWIAQTLVLVWAGRLLHNYFRRERWRFGWQEDWRYADMRKSHGQWWWLSQFFAVSLAQHGMLVGLTMPLEPAMMGAQNPLNALDVIAVVVCLAGIVIGAASDNQLWEYMQLDKHEKPLVLDTGIWRFSASKPFWRADLVVWCAVFRGCFRVALWPICFGVLFNHTLDTFVTLGLIEERMLRRPERRAAYTAYQKRTSLLIPMPPSV